MHLETEQLERLRHRELAPAAERSAREHLASCSDCRERAAEAESQELELHAILRHLDHRPPQVNAESIAARAHWQGMRPARWAAGVLLTLALGGVAYAAPGSPVRFWVRALAAWSRGRPEPRPVPASPRVPSPAVAGIAIAPGQALVIRFESPRSAGTGVGQAVVALTDSAEVVVRAPLGAATFTTDVERLVIDEWDTSATFEIRVPRTAPRVEIRVGDRRIFLKEGRGIITNGVVGPLDQYAIPLGAPRQ